MRAGEKHRQRNAMIFLLRFAHRMSYADLARMFGLSWHTIRQICYLGAKRMLDHAHAVPPIQEPWWRRLRNAGAVPSPEGWFGDRWNPDKRAERSKMIEALIEDTDRHDDELRSVARRTEKT